MKSEMRKKQQKRMNKWVHALNKNIAVDSLWRGRFLAHQTFSDWEKFDDNSGGILRVEILLYDRKNGQKKYIYGDNYQRNGWQIWHEMNTFITEDSNAWKDRTALYADTTDYNKIKVDWEEIERGRRDY